MMIRLVLIFLTFFSFSDALFGFGSGPATTTNTTTTRQPKNLGREIFVPHTDENPQGEIVIPFNNPPKIGDGARPPATTSTTSTTMRTTTTTSATTRSKFAGAKKRLPTSDRDASSNCPNRIDAYAFGPNADYAFFENTVYVIRNDRIIDTTFVFDEFPDGPAAGVIAALYDVDREIFMLFSARQVYGFKIEAGTWKLQAAFPKELPANVGFRPEAAIRWHNKHQVLLSNGGKFALYDEYWNKSLISGRTLDYFPNLPDHVRGVSEWKNGKAHVFTTSLVFEYSADTKGLVGGDGKALGDFWKC